jgi:hypothetical protein
MTSSDDGKEFAKWLEQWGAKIPSRVSLRHPKTNEKKTTASSGRRIADFKERKNIISGAKRPTSNDAAKCLSIRISVE